MASGSRAASEQGYELQRYNVRTPPPVYQTPPPVYQTPPPGYQTPSPGQWLRELPIQEAQHVNFEDFPQIIEVGLAPEPQDTTSWTWWGCVTRAKYRLACLLLGVVIFITIIVVLTVMGDKRDKLKPNENATLERVRDNNKTTRREGKS
jgi:hypothetical protein